MPRPKTIPQIPLPKAWLTQVKSAVLHVIALAQYALIFSRSWAADSSNQRVRLRAECDRLEQEAALLREEIRIKDPRRRVRRAAVAVGRLSVWAIRICGRDHVIA